MLSCTTALPTGLPGVALDGDSSPRTIAFRARSNFELSGVTQVFRCGETFLGARRISEVAIGMAHVIEGGES